MLDWNVHLRIQEQPETHPRLCWWALARFWVLVYYFMAHVMRVTGQH